MENQELVIPKGKKVVYAGRFQPFHNGHLSVVKWILGQAKEVTIVIGSMQEYSQTRHPLTYRQRKEIIEKSLAAENIVNCRVVGMPDFLSDVAWGKKFLEVTGFEADQAVALTSNAWAQESLKKIGVTVMVHPMFLYNLSATSVRKRIADNHNWEELVPKPCAEYLKANGLDKKIGILQMSATERIGEFMRRSVEAAGLKGAVLGVSGGIDSAVAAALAAKAFGKKAHFYFLPFFRKCPYRNNVALLKKALKIDIKILQMDKIIEQFGKVLPEGTNLAYGNLKPRIRMSVLYYFANQKKLMVLGTTNKTEMEIGYFTKYGDGGVDIEPIGDLYKSEIMELAAGFKLPEDVMESAPSAALWPGQTDEKELGMEYYQLDTVLKLLDQGFGTEEVVALTNVGLLKIQNLIERKRKNAHKLAMPPVCVLK